MKIAIISDIHANLYALEAVSKDFIEQKIDDVYCLGDILGYGPHPKECLSLVSKFTKNIVMGNHEAAIWNVDDYNCLNPRAKAGVDFSRKSLDKDALTMVNSLPYTIEVPEIDMVLCHGSFTDPKDFKYITSPYKAKMEIEHMTNKFCIIGHTHIPFVYGEKNGLYEELPDDLLLTSEELFLSGKQEKFVINVGSVGQPRDGDVRACYGVFEKIDDKLTFNLRRCYYDIAKTADAINAVDLPPHLADRLFRGE